MLAIHNQFTRQMRDRLTTTCMGLGLVRLLQDARRFEEAKSTLYSLENSFQDAPEESHKPSQKPSTVNRMKTVTRTASSSSTRNDSADILTLPSFIA